MLLEMPFDSLLNMSSYAGTGTYRICPTLLNTEFIFVAETEQAEEQVAIFIFSKKSMRKCKLGINKYHDKYLLLTPKKGHPDVGTIVKEEILAWYGDVKVKIGKSLMDLYPLK